MLKRIVPLVLVCSSTAMAGEPVARTDISGPALTFDFPGIKIGVAEYEEGPTGATVFVFPNRAMAAVDVRGGAPGTIQTDIVRLGYDRPMVDAIAFSGGSAYGLAVAPGVASAIRDSQGNDDARRKIAIVPGAIIFDLGGRRYTTVTPDFELGRAAYAAAKPGWFPLGGRGAGRFAMQGLYFNDGQHSGQGAAIRLAGPTKVAVFTVVNAVGTVVDRGGNIVRCRQAKVDSCGSIGERLAAKAAAHGAAPLAPQATGGASSNTTITLVVTNQKMPLWALQRLAAQVHGSMARAIQPFATQ